MEKRGLGTKATRHAIIERLLKCATSSTSRSSHVAWPRVIDALSAFAPRITTAGHDERARGRDGRYRQRPLHAHAGRGALARVARQGHVRPHPGAVDVGEALKAAGADDAKVGQCPSPARPAIKSSAKTRGQFVGCSGWPSATSRIRCAGKIEAVDELCPVCGNAPGQGHPVRTKPRVVCSILCAPPTMSPRSASASARSARLPGSPASSHRRRSPRTLSALCAALTTRSARPATRFPQRGELTATGEEWPGLLGADGRGQHGRGPWKICVDPNCPAKAEKAEAAAKKPAASWTRHSRQARAQGVGGLETA